ncbi:hypothetical protein [Nonomuraea coxensis]|nr:hypothetical protein [Nonomuraea coxensis]
MEKYTEERVTAATPDPLLAHRGRDFIGFRDHPFADPGAHGFRWVDLKHFEVLAPETGDLGLVTAVIRHEQFRDDYAGGGVTPGGIRHGPYWLRHVTARAYEPVDAPAVIATMSGWARQHGGLPPGLRDVLEAEVFDRIRRATARYRLKDLGERAHHDWGRVHQDFHEVITIDRTAGAVTLIVAADD